MAGTSVHVEFQVDRTVGGARRVIPAVDGRDLVDLVRTFESSQGFDVPGDYDRPIIDHFVFADLSSYLTGPSDGWPGDGKVALLGCSCGEVGCWPLLARVRVIDDQVVWDSFTQPHRQARDYSGFGPFIFEHSQYRSALQTLASLINAANEHCR
jgi:hypothetical protein